MTALLLLPLSSSLHNFLHQISIISLNIDKYMIEFIHHHSYVIPLILFFLITAVYLYRCRARLPPKIKYIDPYFIPFFGILFDLLKWHPNMYGMIYSALLVLCSALCLCRCSAHIRYGSVPYSSIHFNSLFVLSIH
jgi:hypothetical protein